MVSSQIPAVRMGTPTPGEKDYFTPFEIDGITIWKSHNMIPEQAGDPISIGLKKILFLRDITIDGAKHSVRIES